MVVAVVVPGYLAMTGGMRGKVSLRGIPARCISVSVLTILGNSSSGRLIN